jgi:hypothetical protein
MNPLLIYIMGESYNILVNGERDIVMEIGNEMGMNG